MRHNIYLRALAEHTSNSSMSPSEKNESMVTHTQKKVLFITATWIIYLADFSLSHVIDYQNFLETVGHQGSGHEQNSVTQQLIIEIGQKRAEIICYTSQKYI